MSCANMYSILLQAARPETHCPALHGASSMSQHGKHWWSSCFE